jgi:hypothetical protein
MEAVRYNVLPLDDDLAKKMEPGHGRPVRIRGTSQVLFGGVERLSENRAGFENLNSRLSGFSA